MSADSSSTRRRVVWSAWVVSALLALAVIPGAAYLPVVAVTAAALCLVPDLRPVRRAASPGAARSDVVWVLASYVGVVALMRLAFVAFGTDHVAGLFLAFACALLLGTVVPLYLTVWVRHRPLADLGLGVGDLRVTIVLALVFASIQFALTLWGYDLPRAADWVPLLVMSLVVGVFESIFFRGFVQNRLEEAFGPVAGLSGAAILYGVYHVGYGMGGGEILFLTGLGVVYATAFALTRSVLVLWPLLTPLGSFFNAVEGGDIDLPWASIAGFVDVLAVMGLSLWLAHRHIRKLSAAELAEVRLG